MTWLIALAIFALAAGVAIFAPVRVSLSAQGRADPSGAWAIAGGAELFFFAVTGVAARGITPRFQVHVLGRKVLARELGRGDTKDERTIEERLRAAKSRWDAFARVVDPLDVIEQLVVSRKRIRFEDVDIDTRYGDPDVALVGTITGFLHVLDAVLAPRVRIRPEPVWTGESLVTLALKGDVRVRPGLLAIDTVVFLGKHARLSRLARGTP